MKTTKEIILSNNRVLQITNTYYPGLLEIAVCLFDGYGDLLDFPYTTEILLPYIDDEDVREYREMLLEEINGIMEEVKEHFGIEEKVNVGYSYIREVSAPVIMA